MTPDFAVAKSACRVALKNRKEIFQLWRGNPDILPAQFCA